MCSLAVKMSAGIGSALIFGVGAHEVRAGRISIGDMMMVIAYIGMVYKPLEAISFTLGSLQNNMVNLQMAGELLDLQPEIQDKPGAIEIPPAIGRVEVRGVN